MKEKEAKSIIRKFVLENFNDEWESDIIFLKEYSDCFEFYINSKEFFATGDPGKSFVGLGAGYLSKKHKDIIQYGSLPRPDKSLRDFLITEYRLNIVRTKYKIDRADYNYKVVIKNIRNIEKATNYINGIFFDNGSRFIKELQKNNILNITTVDYFSLLNLLYFNTIDHCFDCSYEKKITEFDLSNPLRAFECLGYLESSECLFYKHITQKVIQTYSTFKSNKNYSVKISSVYNTEVFNQYISTVSFKHYGYDEQTGLVGYTGYYKDEKTKILNQKEKIFDFIEGYEILFFLFINTIDPFCKIEIKEVIKT